MDVKVCTVVSGHRQLHISCTNLSSYSSRDSHRQLSGQGTKGSGVRTSQQDGMSQARPKIPHQPPSAPQLQLLGPFVVYPPSSVSLLCLMVLYFYVSGMVTSPPSLRFEHTLWGTHQPLASGPYNLQAAQAMKSG